MTFQRIHHSLDKEQVRADILQLIQNNDLSDSNTFLVINGGTGVGKTHTIMTSVREKLNEKFQQEQSMLVVESRTAMVEQVNTIYEDQITCFNGIDVCQRLTFMHLIQQKRVDYNWVVIDECHGLFSEASFAEDAEFIVSWIRNARSSYTHIIFVTANDEYFDDLSRQFFPDSYNFIYLFPDFTQYISNTYVKEIQFIKTNRTETIINNFLSKHNAQKGIMFFKKASDVKDWFFKLLAQGYNVGMIVSQANETNSDLTVQQETMTQNLMIDISNGQIGVTMADLCTLFDTIRAQARKETIREALRHERLPSDIDILLATDTIQEGISITTPLNYIFIEGYTEVEVRQKLGRFRGNLDLLYILFNPTTEACRLNMYTETYNTLIQWIKEDNQIALAEFYGIQTATKANFNFILKNENKITGEINFSLNLPAFLNYQHNLNNFLALKNDTEKSVYRLFSYPLLTGNPQILSYNEIKEENQQEKISAIIKKWEGIPLKGEAQEKIIQDFIDNKIINNTRHPINTFRKICNLLGDLIETKKATKKDLEKWPNYLKKLKEEFKIIKKGGEQTHIPI